MAVTLTVQELATALRIAGTGTVLGETLAGIVGRLLGTASAMVLEYAPDADNEDVQNEAVIRIAAYLHDNDAARNRRFSDVLALSGAASILAMFRVQRAVAIDGSGAASPTPGGGGANGLDTAAVNELITQHQELPDAHFAHSDTDHVDQDARDSVVDHNAAGDSHEDLRTAIEGSGGDAYPWATEGHDDEIIPTDKVNLSGVQNQIDEIVNQLSHAEGELTSVVGNLGAGSDSLRYTLPVDLDGLYDISVRVKARVQIGEFANISGALHITEDGGLGLNTVILERTHNYRHSHDGILSFLRKGIAISPGANIIDFTTLVTGNNPPDVHFTDVMDMTITPTPATPTPPAVLVDAAAYIAHGDVTAAGWRDYDFVQLYYAVGGNTYHTGPINTVQLIALSPIVTPIGRNVEWTLTIDATDDDVLTIAQSAGGTAVPAPTATSTITIIAWYAGGTV